MDAVQSECFMRPNVLLTPMTLALAAVLGLATACGGGNANKKDDAKAKGAEAAPAEEGDAATALEVDGNTAIQRFDVNGDDKADVFNYYRVLGGDGSDKTKRVLLRKEVDLNNDQRIDMVTYFEGDPGKEVKIREELDLDFDGRVDETRHYKNGEIAQIGLDLGFDGKTDLWRYYQMTKDDEGKPINRLIEIRRDRNGDGAVDEWEYYVKGKLSRIGYDTDNDGAADKFKKVATN
jgi:hypothetical protein